MNIQKPNSFPIFVTVMALIFFVTAAAQANLLIMPTYIVFQDRDRTQDITIMNTSDRTSIYRMGWLNYKQNERGSYDRQDGPISEYFDPETMIVFSPRQVTLPPNAKQRVRVSLRRPPNLPDGEYRAHLQLQSVGDADGVARSRAGNGAITTEVKANVGFAIPAIIRQGVYNAQVTIEDPSFQPAPSANDTRPRLRITLKRTGAHGALGELRVYWAPPGQEERLIGELNNVNVFSEINQRVANIPLTEQNVNAGTLRIVYQGAGTDIGTTYDEKIIPIGN